MKFKSTQVATALSAAAVSVVLAALPLHARAADPAVALAAKAGCTTCHALDKKLIGPSYKDVAAKYKGKADAVATITQRVRKGSKDVWGPVPMPATDAAKLADADLKTVITWLLKTPG